MGRLAGMVSLALLALLAGATPSAAHEFDPHLVHISERGDGGFTVRWTAPVDAEASLVWPARCAASLEGAAARTRWFRVTCAPPGLAGATLGVTGLPAPADPVLIDLRSRDGARWQHLLRGEAATVVIPRDAMQMAAWPVLRDYLVLGVEHLVLGPDHLLFVLGLLGLLPGLRALIGAATAFTVGHALTLCLAALGHVHLPSAPVEACIALSLVWLARELALRDAPGRPPSMAQRAPWLAAGGFGLLHGLGFAGALAELGVPAGQAPLALAAFNIGIELGQIAVILVALGLGWLIRHRPTRRWAWRLAPVGMGALAMSWVYARTLVVVGL